MIKIEVNKNHIFLIHNYYIYYYKKINIYNFGISISLSDNPPHLDRDGTFNI